jgi:hypothetical protein
MNVTAWVLGPALVAAILLMVAGVAARATRAAAWAAATVIGQAATLLLIEAGPLVGYQHLLQPGDAVRDRPLALATILLIAAAVATGALRQRVAITAWLTGRKQWAGWIALAVTLALGAAPSLDPAFYARELGLLALFQVTILGSAVLSVQSLPPTVHARLATRFDQVLRPADASSGGNRLVLGLAAWVAVLAGVLSLVSYQRIPHVPDEIGYLMQARYFAAGLPWMEPPPSIAAFDTFLLEVDGNRWFSVFPPGWPALLSVGVRLGAPWLVNPVLGGVCVLLTHALVRELSDDRRARLSAALLAFSPWHVFLSMSFMSHVFSLLLGLIAALSAARAWRTRAWSPALLAGLCLGVLGMSRPLEGVAVSAVVGIPLLVAALRRSAWPPVIAMGLGTLATGGLGLWYNWTITGSALLFPAERYFDKVYGPGRYGIGFGANRGVGWTGLDPFPGHGPVDVVVNAVLNSIMINIDLFGWAFGSIALVTWGALVLRERIDRLMLVTIAVIAGVHSLFWFSGGPDFGARYWFLAIVPCVALASHALQRLGSAGTGGPSSRPLLVAAVLIVAAHVTYVPWRASDKYFHYRGMQPGARAIVSDPRFEGALVFVQGSRHPDWSSAAIFNDVDLGASRTVFAWDRSLEARREVLAAFPDRPVWVIAGPSLTGGRYEVVTGPHEAGDVQAMPPIIQADTTR